MKNTVVLMPGPSSVDILWILKTIPFGRSGVFSLVMITLSALIVVYPGYDLILELSSDAGEVGVVTGYPDKKMAVVLRVFLCITQHVRIEHVDLKGGPAAFYIAP